MKLRISLFIVVGITVFLLACNAPTADSQSFVRVVERAKPAIVAIRTYDAFGSETPDKLNTIFFGRSVGSGVIIKYKSKRYILTNYHVIAHEAADFILATSLDGLNGFRSFGVTVVGYDRLSDLAVLEIDPETTLLLSEIEWGNSDTVQIGEWAIAVGYPHQFQLEGSQRELVTWVAEDTREFLYGLPVELFQPSVSFGIISATDKIKLGKVSGKEYLHTNLIQTDAVLNSGNSGGALVNRKGQLIGINTFITAEDGGSGGFAISANVAKKICEQLIDFGYVRPIYLGLQAVSVTFNLQKKLQLPSANGIYVSSVAVPSPAAEAKIKEGDVITSLSGQLIKNERHFKALVRLLSINQEVDCGLIRGGKHKSVKLFPIILGTITLSGGNIIAQPDHKTLENYTHRGVIVTKVISDSFLGKEGLEVGDLIYKINDREIHSLEDFRIFIDGVPKRETMVIHYHIERRIEQHNWHRVIEFNTIPE